MTDNSKGLYILMISPHGLFRGHDMELGRDADTGGQTKYVLELSQALARHPEVRRVDLLTRRVEDARVSDDYAVEEEAIGEGARIVRLRCGPRRYLRKEALWPHLYQFIDNALQYLRRTGQVPDVVHSHYADAGYVGSRLAQLLGVPLIHTGHSLGREKQRRLLDSGVAAETVESRYNIGRRIEAEEITLGNASRVIASTRQEVEEQYSRYENYHPKRMVVIAPGVDLKRFSPPGKDALRSAPAEAVARFLRHPARPMILALSRPDERKNIQTLVRAYGEHPDLREQANLVIVAGNRDRIADLDRGSRQVWTELLALIDEYDLYGHVAYPKHHGADDVADYYRLAAARRGVFVNPALTEPFGLTLLEAAASGLPLIATRDGGPIEILGNCRNGELIDPMDAKALGETLAGALSDRERWRRWSRNGLKGVEQIYSWDAHVRKYIKEIRRLPDLRRSRPIWGSQGKSRMTQLERLVICDIDDTLLGDDAALAALMETLNANNLRVGLGVATGRRLDNTLRVLRRHGVEPPDVIISAVGSEIHYGHRMVEDVAWSAHIDYRWHREELRKALDAMPGLKLQQNSEQSRFKLSYYADPQRMPSLREIRQRLRKLDLHAKLIHSHDAYLDLLPVRASKGLAVRYVTLRWGLPLESVLVAGGSGNDEEMIGGGTLGVVVANHSGELEHLRDRPRIHFSGRDHAWAILDGIEHYNFFGDIRIPNEESDEP